MRHVLDMDDLTAQELSVILDLAARPDPAPVLAGQAVAMVFQKPSLRTRVSMERATAQLGGHPVSVRDEEVGVDRRESAEDVARLLSQYAAVVGARVFGHEIVERLAAAASVPVVNLLSDAAHPCQILGDLFLLRRRWGPLDGHTVAWVGDGNNVCQSLLLGAALCGLHVRVASPPGHEPSPDALADAGALLTADPAEAVAGAEAVYTDVWTSMGQEDEAAERRRVFAGYTVDEDLMARAAPDALFLHCLPAHRGEEVSAGVIDGPQSAVWEQAACRMHAQRGLLWWLAENGSTEPNP
jgi:ornithine carbamoyltransferase